MAFNSARNNWNNCGYIVAAVAAGLLYGVSPVLLKMASFDFYLSFYSVAAAVASVGGFFVMQKSLHAGRISIVVSIITALTIITTFALSIIIFGETVSLVKWLGAAAIIIGAVNLIARK
jgi:multidrug transporter EmrE-like cation transporter